MTRRARKGENGVPRKLNGIISSNLAKLLELITKEGNARVCVNACTCKKKKHAVYKKSKLKINKIYTIPIVGEKLYPAFSEYKIFDINCLQRLFKHFFVNTSC